MRVPLYSALGVLPVTLQISSLSFGPSCPLGVSSLRCLHSPTGIFSMSPDSPREVFIPPSGVFTLLSPEAFSLPLGVPHSPDSQGSIPPPTSHPHPHPVVWLQVELSDGTAHTITDAYAGKEYIIQVAAKDNEIGTWSDWSVAAHATPWTEEPRHLTTEAQSPGELPPPPPTPSLHCCLALSCSLRLPGP